MVEIAYLCFILALFTKTGSKIKETGMIKVLSLNTNGLNNPIKRKRVLQQVKKEKAGIVYLQETHLNDVEHVKLKKLAGAQVFHSSHTKSQERSSNSY